MPLNDQHCESFSDHNGGLILVDNPSTDETTGQA